MAGATTVKLEFHSEIRVVDVVHAASESMAELAGFADADVLNVALAVREAVVNAIVHGNRKNPSLLVEVEFVANGDGLTTKVRDRGEGFDPSANPDPTLEQNRLKDTGRGLLLMRAFVDEVIVRPNHGRGTEVVLVKRRHAAGTGSQMGPALSGA